MAITYTEPKFGGSTVSNEPQPFLWNPAQGAAWRRGSILVLSTTGTLTAPAPTGSMSTTAGPQPSAVTLSTSASANAPAQTYYIQVTYTATTNESLLSPLYIVNAPFGFVPTVNVAAAGAPAAATNFAAYIGLTPGYVTLQQATKTTTALGATYTAANPLTNSAGALQAVTNVSANILGIAQNASNENYFDGYSGSFTAGGPGSRLGMSNTIEPLTPTEAPLSYISSLGFGTLWEFNANYAMGVITQYSIGTQVGLTLDATTGWFTVDSTQSNKIARIQDIRQGAYIGPTASSDSSGLGTRVLVEFNSGLIE